MKKLLSKLAGVILGILLMLVTSYASVSAGFVEAKIKFTWKAFTYTVTLP